MHFPRSILSITSFFIYLAFVFGTSALNGKSGSSSHDLLVQKLKTIVIPEVKFVEAPLPEVLTFLHFAARKHDPQAIENPQSAGVNIVLLTRENPSPTVTLDTRNLTLGVLLEFITELTGYVYEVREQAVVVRKLPPKKRKQSGGLLLQTVIYEFNEGLKRRLVRR
ncbi:MAG: hypothetical protein CMI26_07370 [Opitutae bacterium]|jgi:hypothetical protein|nr:hypothetical protein [Opitutae bacterium]|tara:strand:- start:152 stop:649 length:498 start_codon:yes stop_codon:yes gene_type:complete